MAKRIGKLARPKRIIWADDLPKTRSGKIMRRLLRDIAEGRELGDVTTLRDPDVMSQLEGKIKERGDEDGTSPRLHWEDTGGSGPPVLLIMGLGMNATGWWRTIPALARVPRAVASTTAAWGALTACRGRTRWPRWPTTPSRCSMRRASIPRTSTASRSAG